MKQIRYDYLIDIVDVVKPKSIIEIGVAMGKNAIAMSDRARKHNRAVQYTGYDVFDSSDKEFHKLVGNRKEVLEEEQIRHKLKTILHNENIRLIKGMTQDTLWSNPNKADITFIDGDHRIDAIRGDFEAVKDSRVIVFDDYYQNNYLKYDKNKYGCYSLAEELICIITPKTHSLGEIQLAIYTEDEDLKEQLKKVIL